MKIVDLNTLPSELNPRINDAKEGLVDALLNLTWQRSSGAGPDGQTVFGTKPSMRFVSGFLLPRYEETGQGDETSDIHLSTHGLDCQIAADAKGNLGVSVFFSIYVRALPEWDELTRPELDLFPNPPLRRELERSIRNMMKDRLANAVAAENSKPEDQRRHRSEIQQQIYHELLAEHGVKVSANAWVADEEDSMETDSQQEGEDKGAQLAVQHGQYIFDDDQAAQEIDIPQKWQRLPVTLDSLSADLSDQDGLQEAVAAWTGYMRTAVTQAVETWTASDEGRNAAYRPASIRPSNFRSKEAWNAFLADLRRNPPTIEDIVPNLDGLQLAVQLDSDLRDPNRRNLRVMLENNSNEVSNRRRERFDHSIHQVQLNVNLPHSIHCPLKLDRVEASYRFRDFLTYPAIGINCGVTETRKADRLHLNTTWMPRYQQPRIAPTEVKNASVVFSDLGADGFNPADLRLFVDAYGAWIDTEEKSVDPAHGVENMDEADREKKKFRQDIEGYRREVQRITLGIELLEFSFKKFKEDAECREAIPYRAWLLLNRTFHEAGAERGIKGWRLFQATFLLAHIPTVVSRMDEYAGNPWFDHEFDEETATLLYFSTGGGKSEAFFGLLTFNLFLDRLRGKNTGVTALIRYPLRLLTLQQAQRLLAILMRAELLRRSTSIPGQPFEIGFWVGSGNTPNRPDDPRLDPVPRLEDPSHKTDDNLKSDYRGVNKSFNKIPSCPACGQLTGLRRISFSTAKEIGIICFNADCQWNKNTGSSPLPLLIVDRDIYRHAPAVLLGIIDKLALIGQHPATINRVMGMFGLARWQELDTGRFVMPSWRMLKDGSAANSCEPLAPAYHGGREVFHDPFPSLIIQDEAHLLEESLGTFAGLFETMLEQLFVRASDLLGDRVARSPFGTKPVRLPKIVAATATVSVPQRQFGSLYQRRHMHFPYPGTSIYRSFYAAPAEPIDPARRGIGGQGPCAPEIEAPWMRIYASIMTNGRNHTVTTVSVLAAYHLAITEFWRDLRDDRVRDTALQRLLDALTPSAPLTAFHTQAIKICAQKNPDLIPTLLDLMRISLTYVTNKKGGDQVIDAFREEVAKVHQRHNRDLTRLHTRLISGGVDVAQIQEIMREAEGSNQPGGDFPDLEQSLRNIVATSAISHGVDVDNFNAMFFAGMPNDIAEFIQASSRVGRVHTGFSLLIPTPHARRDRYIVETHDVFHRFLERMIAPPAITRWAASAHDRVLTSLFQAWLCGWAEQKLFIESPDKNKEKAPRLETVNDVSRLLNSNDIPEAGKNFTDFAVLALGVQGRGVNGLGAAPNPEFYDERLRNLAKPLVDELCAQYTTTRLSDFWDGAPVGTRPMMSLRDIDEAGRFVAARPLGSRPIRGEDEKKLIAEALRIVRRQSGSVSELDSEEKEN